MLIGNKYAENKIYRGIKHYNTLPLTSEDIHESADTMFMKNSYFMNNLLGSGTLNEPKVSISSTGVSLLEPSVLLIEGDISLIQADSEILKVSDIISSGVSSGVLCVVGWYQSLNSSSTLRSYGGVSNSVLENDLVDPNLQMQVSTRYQFRWDTVIVDRSLFESDDNISISLNNRDATGALTTGTTTITTISKTGTVRVASKPTSMDYALSSLYIVPIMYYDYVNTTLSNVSVVKSIKVGGVSITSSNTAPTRPDEGTIWYDLNSSRFKIYIEGQGFVDTNVDYELAQYSEEISITEEYLYSTPSDIILYVYFEDDIIYVPENGDILQVIYEGLLLTEGIHYEVDSSDRSMITLKEFTTELGESITVNLIKLEASRESSNSGGTLITF